MKFHLLFTLAVAAFFVPVDADDRLMERAKLHIQAINHFEESVKKAVDEESKRTAEAMVKVLFAQLKSDYALKDLDNYTLVRMGDFLRTKTSTPLDALAYYDEVLGREDKSYRYDALLGRAEVYQLSPKAEDLDKAINDCTRVYEESVEHSLRERALYRKIDLLMKKGELAKVTELARIYLDREKTAFAMYTAEVSMLLAESLEKQNMKDEAIAIYAKVWASNTTMGRFAVYTPMLIRWMELSWERNKPAENAGKSDRQGAYETGARYLQLTSQFKEKFTKEDLKQWEVVEKLVHQYEASPDIKPLPKG